MRSVVVTGASTGIGHASVKLLLDKGFKVFGSVRKQADADRLTSVLGANFIPLLFDVTDEAAVKNMGNAAVGIVTAWHYDYNHDSALNREFVKGYNEANPGPKPNFFSVGGYDGMHLIYETLKKTNGNADGDALIAAAKGMKWESPRGPVQIDPETRDIILTVYINKVTKGPNGLANGEIDKIENVKDPVKARMPQ